MINQSICQNGLNIVKFKIYFKLLLLFIFIKGNTKRDKIVPVSIQQIWMIKQEQPPSSTQLIQKILAQLNLKSIEQILQSDHINVDFLAKTTNVHKSVVLKLLNDLRDLINRPEECVPNNKYTISLRQVVSGWAQEPIGSPLIQKIKDIQIGSSQILEIIGRANGGKSYFCFEFALHCLKKGLTIIFIDSNQNSKGLKKYLECKLALDQKLFNQVIKRVLIFEYRTLSQFSILIHNLGNVLIQQKSKPATSLIQKGLITFIDCLSRIEMADPDTDEQNSTMDFDIIQKIKKLLVTYSIRVSSIVYTNRVPTAFTLFNTFYKNQKQRPRCKNNNAKLWDSISSKTVFVDYAMTMANHEVKKIHFTKEFTNEILTFEK